MAAYGLPEMDIATVIGIDSKTLRKHYRRELDTGQIKANTKVAENLFRKATGDGREAVIAAIFWMKTRAQWKETSVSELAAKGGEPLNIVIRRFSKPDAQDRTILGWSTDASPLIEHSER